MSSSTLKPRLIVHGGAGHITRENLYPKAWESYRSALLNIHRSTSVLLSNGASALDAATHAVASFEDSPLFNCGKGAVFTRDGAIELEASVMVTRDFHKRACAVVLVSKVKNPIKLAREMLVRGEQDGSGDGDLNEGARGAQGHCCLGGKTVERLAKDWGLEMVDESYFWTRRRWDEHKRGLHESEDKRTLRQNMETWPYGVNSCTFLVGLAILQAPGLRATVSEISEWLSKKATWRAGPQHVWQTRVSAELNQETHGILDRYLGEGRYFMKQQPRHNETHGPEPYWTIIPDKVSHFVKARDEGYALHNKYEEHEEDKSRWPLFPEQDSGWDGQAYLPQGTVGCVALDQHGTICVATSTGGLTNKLSGRIGDTPTIGAGFWAEEWYQSSNERRTRQPENLLPPQTPSVLSGFADGLRNVLGDCIPNLSGYQELPSMQELGSEKEENVRTIRAVAMSGTGNGDSFLRLSAARTAGAIVRFSPNRSLASAVSQVAGPGGELQQSAGDRWGKTGEGEGGIIGIELVDGKGKIVFDFNCGGMFRCWVDDQGNEKVMVFKDEY